MKTLNVEFLPVRNWKNDLTKLGAAAVAVFVAVQIVQIGLMYTKVQTARSETELVRDRLNTLRAEREAAHRANTYDEGAQLALKAAQFPLEAALSSLEEITVAGVQVTSLDLNLPEGTAKAELESQSSQALEKYLSELGNPEHSSEWRIIKIQEASGVPLPSGAPGPLPPGLLPSAVNMKAALPKASGPVSVVLGWGTEQGTRSNKGL
jgi:hypothetical protein